MRAFQYVKVLKELEPFCNALVRAFKLDRGKKKLGPFRPTHVRAYRYIEVSKELVPFCNAYVWAFCFKGEKLGSFCNTSVRAF